MQTIEIPLVPHGKPVNERYIDYLIKVSSRILDKAKLMKNTDISTTIVEFNKIEATLKDDIEILIAVMYERNNRGN